MNCYILCLLLVQLYCVPVFGCGGSNGASSQSACTYGIPYKERYSYRKCWAFFCRTRHAYRIRHRTGYRCSSTHTLKDKYCYRNGKWNSWSSWSHCSSESGNCHRTRSCINKHSYGKACSGSTTTYQSCTRCSVTGKWGSWAAWSHCSSLSGTCSRTRQCNNPSPKRGGQNCPGSHLAASSCSSSTCPVDGGWGSWASWSHCSSRSGSCGRSRQCNSPSPVRGGKNCPGSSTSSSQCSGSTCPVDGTWSSWTPWTHCTSVDDESKCLRHRQCDSPTPANDGRACAGSNSSLENCGGPVCPVTGSWSLWTAWTHCDSLEGSCNRSRICNKPSAANEGVECEGDSSGTEICGGDSCPVDGSWSQWGNWSHCSSIHDGSQCSKKRCCDNPPPAHGGDACLGPVTHNDTCGGPICPVDGGWAPWTPWTSCKKKERFCLTQRWCASPLPVHGGKECEGDTFNMDRCRKRICLGAKKEEEKNVQEEADETVNGSEVEKEGEIEAEGTGKGSEDGEEQGEGDGQQGKEKNDEEEDMEEETNEDDANEMGEEIRILEKKAEKEIDGEDNEREEEDIDGNWEGEEEERGERWK